MKLFLALLVTALTIVAASEAPVTIDSFAELDTLFDKAPTKDELEQKNGDEGGYLDLVQGKDAPYLQEMEDAANDGGSLSDDDAVDPEKRSFWIQVHRPKPKPRPQAKPTGSNMCPRDHPYAYLNGDYCCKFNREKHYWPAGSRCDGSVISLSSSCCQGDQHTRCPHGKCVNFKEPVVQLKAPVVTAEASGNRVRFRCEVFPDVKYLMYEVRWFNVRKSGRMVVKKDVLNSQTVSFLQNTDDKQDFVMGTKVFAEVRALKSVGQPVGKWFSSNVYFAGFKLSPSTTLRLYNNGLPTELTITQTVPIICSDGSTDCKVYVRFTHPNTVEMSQCTVAFPANTATMISHTVSVIIKREYIGKDVNGEITANIHGSDGLEDDWNDPEGPPVTITTTPVTTGDCSSTGDPHFNTFDSVKFNHYRVGEYTLVQSKVRKFTVQARTYKCARVACNCAVAVREGDDVLVVDMCKGDFNPRARYGSKQEPQLGTYIERNGDGKEFILHFKSGARVSFLVKRWYGSTYYANINVRLPPSDSGETVGLCGSLDNNGGNDMMARNGKVYAKSCGGSGCSGFTESWKVSASESLFLYNGGSPTCLPKIGEAPGTFCACSQTSVFPFKGDQCKVTENPTEIINKKGFTILAHPISKKCKVEVEITVRPTTEIDIFPWEPVQPTGPFPTWPLTDGTTVIEARKYCTLKMTGTAIYHECKKLIKEKFSITALVKNCVADIKLTSQKLAAALSAIDAMVDSCTAIVTTNIDYWITVDGGSKVPPPIGEFICPNECSGNGKCVGSKCKCNDEYTADDCSLEVGTVPSIVTIPFGGLCDLRKDDCVSINVLITDFNPGTAVVGYYFKKTFTNLLFKLISFREIYISIDQRWIIKYSVHTHGVAWYKYLIVISNDGHKFCKPKPFIVYDSKCMSCDIIKGCHLKPDTCNIRGYCFSAGEKDPNDSNKVCDPSKSTGTFTVIKVKEEPKKIWEKVGCFNDYEHPRPLSVMLLDRKDPSSPKWDGITISWKKYPESLASLVEKCSKLAKEAGYKYIGIQNFGECYGGNGDYARNGVSTNCVNDAFKPCEKSDPKPCAGKDLTNYVYKVEVDDPCATENGGCSQVCKSEGSAVLCSCNEGFTLNKDSKSCDEVHLADPCAIKNGGCSQVCLSEGSAVLCSCNEGFELNKDGKNCDRIDPCAIKNGGCSQVCMSEGSAVLCSCNEGFKPNKDGKTCDKIDPCATENGGCSQVCKSEGSAVLCSCNEGFTLNKDSKSCNKADPCAIKNGGCSQVCLSEGSAVLCSCNEGFKPNKDGKTCDKIDPCARENGGCSQVCKSEGTDVLCSCNEGFKLSKDAKSCDKVDPCATENGGCSQVCKSEGSAVLCSCNEGFTLNKDAKSCDKVDPCATKNGGCSQVCKSEGSAALCSCNKGFKLNKDTKSCHKVCEGIADIGFVLDSSGSLKDNYQDEKNFLKSLSKSFGVSKEGSHAGVVTFSLKSELSIKFNQYLTQKSFDKAVDDIRHFNKFTRIDLALKQAKDELFAEKNGARPGVAKLCVLITDGTQTKMGGAEDPAKIAAQMRAKGIKTIVVGIGAEVKSKELANIAGNPADAYTAANFEELKKPEFAEKVKKAMCEEKEVS